MSLVSESKWYQHHLLINIKQIPYFFFFACMQTQEISNSYHYPNSKIWLTDTNWESNLTYVFPHSNENNNKKLYFNWIVKLINIALGCHKHVQKDELPQACWQPCKRRKKWHSRRYALRKLGQHPYCIFSKDECDLPSSLARRPEKPMQHSMATYRHDEFQEIPSCIQKQRGWDSCMDF